MSRMIKQNCRTLSASQILLVGASGGLGQALVKAMCALPEEQRPQSLYLCGRNEPLLQDLCIKVQSCGIKAIGYAFDLRRQDHIAYMLQSVLPQGLDKVVLASGISLSADASGLEPLCELERGFAVNTLAPCRLICTFASQLKPGSQVVVLSSLAARLPLPSSPVYSASKGALSLYVRAMQPLYRSRGLTLSLVEPGFFASPMSDRYQGSKPALVSAGFAAEKIISVMKSGKSDLSFPGWLNVGSAALSMLPAFIQKPFLQQFFRFKVLPDKESMRNQDITCGKPGSRMVSAVAGAGLLTGILMSECRKLTAANEGYSREDGSC